MAPHPHALAPVDRVRAALDAGRGHRGRVRVLAERDGREALQEADEHERDLVVCELRVEINVSAARKENEDWWGESCGDAVAGDAATHLLTETDTRPGVEREEDERVGHEVLLHALVDEPLRVERQRCPMSRTVSTVA